MVLDSQLVEDVRHVDAHGFLGDFPSRYSRGALLRFPVSAIMRMSSRPSMMVCNSKWSPGLRLAVQAVQSHGTAGPDAAAGMQVQGREWNGRRGASEAGQRAVIGANPQAAAAIKQQGKAFTCGFGSGPAASQRIQRAPSRRYRVPEPLIHRGPSGAEAVARTSTRRSVGAAGRVRGGHRRRGTNHCARCRSRCYPRGPTAQRPAKAS